MLSLAFVSSLSVGLAHVGGAESRGNVVQSNVTQYYLGEEIIISDRQITVDGKKYDAQVAVYHPDGNAYAENRLVLDELGAYVIEYRAVVDGKLYTERETLETIVAPYTVTGNGQVKYGKDESPYDTGISGLNITLKKDEVFRYNDVINLKKINLENIVELYLKPTGGAGIRDVGKIGFKLEDVNDPDNYVTVYASSVGSDGGGDPWWSNATYLQAGFAGQSTVGVEWGSRVHSGGQFGFPVQFSMYGNRNFKESVGDESLCFRYDVTTKELFGPADGEKRHIVDLDDKKYFNTHWDGFSTDEVYLSVWGEQYYREEFSFAITKIGNADLSREVIRDGEGPDIEIDYGNYSETEIPFAMKGCAYPVFAATASDIKQPVVEVNERVVYNYSASTRYEIAIVDGKFIPDKEGLYTIEYSAYDRYGNASFKTVNVRCVAEDALRLELDAGERTGKTGYRVELAQASVSGGSGVNPLSVTVLFGDREMQITDNGFTPTKAGRYTVKYVASDFVGHRAEESYEIVVENDIKPVLVAPAQLPKYLIAGAEMKLPEASAFDYATDTKITCRVFVTDGACTEKEITARHSFTPAQDGTAQIIYRAGSGEAENEWVYTLPVVTAITDGAPDLLQYFYGDNVNPSLTNYGVDFIVREGGDAAFEFIRPLCGNRIKSVVRLDNDHSAYEKAALALTGSDGAVAAVAEFIGYGAANAYSVAVNGKPTGINVRGNTDITLVYDFENGAVQINGNTVKCEKVSSGTGYYFSGRMENAAENGVLRVVSLQEQSFTSGRVNISAPAVQPQGSYSLAYAQNGILYVLPAEAYSVLSPVTECTVSVTDATGANVYTTDGEALRNLDASIGYEIVLERIGNYKIIYKTKDVFGQIGEQTFTIGVVDSVGPEIVLVGDAPVTSAKVGDEITICPAVGIDAVDEECTVVCFVVDPFGDINPVSVAGTRLQGGMYSLKVTAKGKYVVRYFSVDKSGNTTIVDYTVTVE